MNVDEFDWEDVEIGRNEEEVRFRARDLGRTLTVVFYEISATFSKACESIFLNQHQGDVVVELPAEKGGWDV